MPTPQPSLPSGTKKLVIFDTNAYRMLGRRNVQALRQRELACGVLALAHPGVVVRQGEADLVQGISPADARRGAG